MMTIKRIIAVAFTLVITLSANTAMASKTYTLSLEKAQEMALTDSPELALCEVNRQKVEKQLKDAALSQKDYKNMDIHINQNFDLIYVKNGYYVKMFRKYSELSKKEKLKTESAIKYNTTNDYYTLKSALKLCKVYENAVKRAEDNLEVVKKKYSLGMCTALEVTNAEISLDEAKAGLLKAESNAELLTDSLRIRLNTEEDAAFILTDEISRPNNFESDLAADTKNAMKTRYDVAGLEISAELAKDYYQTASSLNEDSVTFFTSYADYIKAANNYSLGVKNISLAIKNAYYNAINAEISSDIAKRKFEYKKSEYEVNKVRYEMGMITNNILTALSDELTMAELEYENALLSHKLAVEKYAYETTTGV
ncbi:MAG: TolC family protein [Ruminococcaceae bacterium]|nr:TolC family protein [Oscillospiraceae bacterium]